MNSQLKLLSLLRALSKTSNIYFKDFYLYKEKKSGNFLCAMIWGSKKKLAFVTVPLRYAVI